MATIYIQDQNYEGSYGLSDFQVKCTVLGFLAQSPKQVLINWFLRNNGDNHDDRC